MSVVSIRLSHELSTRLADESAVTNKPKSLLLREALVQFLARQKRDRLIAQLTRAAAAVDTREAAALAEEALPFDNEALALGLSAGERDAP